MPNNNFRPDDEVPRAEFATALSRMIYKMSD
ncbi:S-layer homology domain-containing protein [bacterium]|nr:S-layer homology domain-containing protein [bacterium]